MVIWRFRKLSAFSDQHSA